MLNSSISQEEIYAARNNLLPFCKFIFKYLYNEKFSIGRHHTVICHKLEKVLLGHIQNLIICVPPRFGKTELAINFIAWSLGLFPDSNYIHTSYTKTLASDSSKKVRDLVASGIYRLIFPNVHLAEDSKARDFWRTKEGGQMYAVGAGGSITGFGAGKKRSTFINKITNKETILWGGCILCDDPHKVDEAYSKLALEKTVRWFDSTLASRRNHEKTPLILIMQRLNPEDLVNHLAENYKDDGLEQVILPAEDSKGEPLWAEFLSAEALAKKKEAIGSYAYNGQYLQNPQIPEGSVFNMNWWGCYNIDDPPSLEYRIITGDTAQKKGEANDYSVFQLWGYAEGKAYLLDMIRGKWLSPELRRNLLAFYNKHHSSGQTRGALRTIYIEEKSSGTGLIDDIKDEFHMPIKGIPRTKDKLTRAMDILSYVESGCVFIPYRENKPLDMTKEFLNELTSFSALGTHKHDDITDTTIDGINILLQKRKRKVVWGV